jgi:hypothetical protein
MLGDLFELELCRLISGPEQYYVKMGRDCRLKAVKCIKGVKDKELRIRRRICSGGEKRKVFVDTLLDLIASEWNDQEMEAWLTSDAEQVKQTNKKGNSTCCRSQMLIPVPVPFPPKDDGIDGGTPNALSNSALQATLVPPNEFLRQGKSAEKEEFPFLYAFGVPIDNDDTLHGLFRDLQKRLRTTEHTTGDSSPAEGFVYQTINSKPELMIPISKASSRSGQDKFVKTLSSALAWATSDVTNKDSEAETVKAVLGFLEENYSEVFVEKKMDAVTAAAMAEQANINTTGMRIISVPTMLVWLQHPPTQCQLRAVGDQYLRPQSYREDQWKFYRLLV